MIDEEVDRLPAAYRRAVVLCYLEGKSQEDAACELGWTKGTVSGRLARAKDLLRARLTRRGFAPSSMLVGTLLAPENAEAAVPASLARGSVRQAVGVLLSRAETLAASGAVAALARGALRATLLNKLKLAVLTLLFLGLIASGAGLLGRSLAMTKDEPRPSPTRVRTEHVAKSDETTRSVPSDRITIAGRVLSPDGKPVSGAGGSRGPPAAVAGPRFEGTGPKSGAGLGPGRRRGPIPDRVPPDRARTRLLVPGRWSDGMDIGRQGHLASGPASAEETITLEPERLFRGRLIDLQSQPIRGAIVQREPVSNAPL